jgi:hypothetical protein
MYIVSITAKKKSQAVKNIYSIFTFIGFSKTGKTEQQF